MPGYDYSRRGFLTRGGGLNAQGGIATSSGLTVAGTATISSAATVTGTLTGSSRVVATLGFDEPVTQSSSGVELVAYGTHVFTTAADATYTLANPTQGVPIHFCGIVATGSTHTIIPTSTEVLFTSSSGGTNGRALSLAGTAAASVMCTSSGKLAIIGSYGTVVVSSST